MFECKTIQDIHAHQGLEWNSDEQQLPSVFFFNILSMVLLAYFKYSCLGHVINLGNIDMMGHIMKIAAVKNVTAI